jgi:hypothetical protein
LLHSFVKKFDKAESFIDFIIELESCGMRKDALNDIVRVEEAIQDELLNISQLTRHLEESRVASMLDPDSFPCPTALTEQYSNKVINIILLFELELKRPS